MKNTRTGVSAINKIIICLLCIILCGIIMADVMRRHRTKELTASITTLSSSNPAINILQQNISDLYESDNNFRLYAATYDRSYFYKYYDGLKKIHLSIDSLRQHYKGPLNGLEDKASLDETFKKKLAINNLIIDLKKITDSALVIATKLDTSKNAPARLPYYKIPVEKITRSDTTITSQKEAKRKGFFQRVKTLFSDNDKDTVTVNRLSATSIEHDSAVVMINNAVRSVEDYYRKHLKTQVAARNMLNSKDKELVLLNFSLIDRLNQTLHSFQQQEQYDQDQHKKKALAMALYSGKQLSLLAIFSFVIIISLLLLILYNIYQVNIHAKKLSIARLEAEKQARAKSNLMASVSHEIRNPLTVIRGFTELLHNSNLSAAQHEQLKAVKAASDLLLSTVNDILDFSKLEAGKMSVQMASFQPVRLVEEAYVIMKSLAEQKGLTLAMETTGSDRALAVQGDAFRLKQMLVNLVSNAIKFTNQGKITIKVFSSKAPGSNEIARRTFVHFEVADTGIGIPADKIQDVFNEFEQVKEGNASHAGTGLGLAICRKIVRLHQGTIDATSKMGAGSVFRVKLNLEISAGPAAKDPLPGNTHIPLLPHVKTMPSGELKEKKILLVDDNPLILQLALILLKKQEAIVTTAEDGTQAWELFNSRSFDMVLTDINLPGISGLNLAINIRGLADHHKAHVPILALTGDITAHDIDKYRVSGIDDYIIKPFNEKELLEKLEKYIRSVPYPDQQNPVTSYSSAPY